MRPALFVSAYARFLRVSSFLGSAAELPEFGAELSPFTELAFAVLARAGEASHAREFLNR